MPESEFNTYVAQTELELGDTDFKIEPGDQIKFDGNRKAVIGGEEFDFPNLAGCIKKGWLQDTNQTQNQSQAPPPKQSANIEMSAPTPQGESTVPAQDVRSGRREHVVGTVNQNQGQAMNQQQNPRQQRQQPRQNPQQRQHQSNQGNVRQGGTRNTQQQRGQMPVHGSQGQPVGGDFDTSAKNYNQKVTRGTTGAATGAAQNVPRSTVGRQARGGQQTEGEQRAQKARQMRRQQMQNRQGPQAPQQPQPPQQQQPQNQGRQISGDANTRAEGMEFDNQGISNAAARKGGANGLSQQGTPQGSTQQPMQQGQSQGYSQLNPNTQQAPQQPPAPQSPQTQQQPQARQHVEQAQNAEGLNDVDFSEDNVVEETETVRVTPEVSEELEIPDDYDLSEKEERLDFIQQVFPDLNWEFEEQWRSKIKRLGNDDQFEDPAKIRAVYAIESVGMKEQIEDAFEDVFAEADAE